MTGNRVVNSTAAYTNDSTLVLSQSNKTHSFGGAGYEDVNSLVQKLCFRLLVDYQFHSLAEAALWFLVAVISILLNAFSVFYFVFIKSARRFHEKLNANLFIIHLVFGTMAQVNVGIIFVRDECVNRMITLVSTMMITVSSLVTLISIAIGQLKRVKKVAGESNEHEVSRKRSIQSIVFVWVFSLGNVLIKVLQPTSYVPIFVVFILSIILLALYLITSSTLKRVRRQFSEVAAGQERATKMSCVTSCDEALKIILVLQISTLITWLPASLLTLVNRIGVQDSATTRVLFVIGLRLLFLPPLLDPLSLFWSSAKMRNRLRQYLFALLDNHC
eukprot:gene19251-21179_t